MIPNINNFIDRFYEIRKMGYIDSIVKESAGVGRTFEQLLGIKGNCDVFPDYEGIEIKTKTSERYKELSLFNCTPIGESEHEIERLKEKYGYPDKECRKYKVLFVSVNCLEKSKIGIFYKFQLKVDIDRRKILLLVFDLKDNLIDESTFWPLDLIEERFIGKCSTLAFINAEKGYKCGHRSYWYKNLKIMKPKPFEMFIYLLEKGIIKIDFKVGISKDKEKLGKIFDHGTAFKIDEKNLGMLFDIIYNSNEEKSSI